ncbi:MAG: hypothetical protein J7K51_03815 [Thermotogae bacterium]|nr:hypothetical protein [Thermotogota bacterium]
MILFDFPGNHTDEVLKIILKIAEERVIDYLVFPSTTGDTARKISRFGIGKDIKPIIVTHHIGFNIDGEDEMAAGVRERLRKMNIPVLTATHLFAGLDRAFRKQFGGIYPAEIVAMTLRMFSEGIKVAVEIAVMAADAGLVPVNIPIISTGGTDRYIDSAVVIKPSNSSNFFSTRILEILCMPRPVKKEVG